MSDAPGMVAAVSRNDAYTFTKPNRDAIVLVAGIGVEGDVHAGVHVRHRGRVRADPTQPNLRQVHLIQEELFAEVAEKGYDVPAGGLGENVTTRGLNLLGMPPGTILRFGPPATERAVGALTGRAAESRPGAATGSGAETGPDVVSARAAESCPGAEKAPRGGEGRGNGSEAGVAVLRGVLAAAGAATLDEATARAVAAVAAAAGRDAGDDPRPAVVLAGLRNPCVQINGFRNGLLKEVLTQDAAGNVVRKAGVMAVVLRGGVIHPGDPVAVELPPGSHPPLERV
jgi:MOSC domain-containing protein YiiM